jgi:hypothetical protein
MKGSTMMKRESAEEIRERLRNNENVRSMIQARAYEIYLTRRGASGGEFEDWVQAEIEVLAFLVAQELSQEPVQEPGQSTTARATDIETPIERKEDLNQSQYSVAEPQAPDYFKAVSQTEGMASQVPGGNPQSVATVNPSPRDELKTEPDSLRVTEEKKNPGLEATVRKSPSRSRTSTKSATPKSPKQAATPKQPGEAKKKRSPKKSADPGQK